MGRRRTAHTATDSVNVHSHNLTGEEPLVRSRVRLCWSARPGWKARLVWDEATAPACTGKGQSDMAVPHSKPTRAVNLQPVSRWQQSEGGRILAAWLIIPDYYLHDFVDGGIFNVIWNRETQEKVTQESNRGTLRKTNRRVSVIQRGRAVWENVRTGCVQVQRMLRTFCSSPDWLELEYTWQGLKACYWGPPPTPSHTNFTTAVKNEE